MTASSIQGKTPFWRTRKGATWDVAIPIVGIVFLFLEVSPRPIFGWNFESYRILAQFPLLAIAFLCAWEKRFFPAILSAAALGTLQGWPGLASLSRESSLETLFPALAWTGLLLSYLHPARRGIYLVPSNEKESKP